jgi:phage RecT family recombinase
MAEQPQDKSLIVYQNPGDLKKYLETAKGALTAALPSHLNAERMMRLALTSFSTTPKLRQCTGQSILASLVIASQLGLEPGVRGQGYLIPYRDNRRNVSICTFVPGWQGLVGLLNNTGRATCWTGAVYKGDEFTFQLGSRPRLDHVPGDLSGTEPFQNLTHVYACAQVNGADLPVIECWRMPRVWAHRDKFNKVGNDHYSYKHPEMYARKVVLLQVLKYMPSSIEVTNALAASDAAEAGRMATIEGTGRGAVIVDMEDESGGLGEGNIGGGDGQASITEMAQGGGGGGGAAAKSGAPTAKELLDSILAAGGKIDAGKAKIEKAAKALRYLEPAEKLDALPAEKLATILDSWAEIQDEIMNPGGSR